jgi:hypothetical protein
MSEYGKSTSLHPSGEMKALPYIPEPKCYINMNDIYSVRLAIDDIDQIMERKKVLSWDSASTEIQLKRFREELQETYNRLGGDHAMGILELYSRDKIARETEDLHRKWKYHVLANEEAKRSIEGISAVPEAQ